MTTRMEGDMGELTYNKWAVNRLSKGMKCKLEESMACIPLREDPLCQSCFEAVKSAQKVCTDACINDEVLRLKSDLAEAVRLLELVDIMVREGNGVRKAKSITDFLTKHKQKGG